MRKEAKFVCYSIGLACLAMFILSGCQIIGRQGEIYHDGIIIAKTNCAMDLGVEITPEHVIVKTYGKRLVQEKYMYVNDGKYRIERKECDLLTYKL